MKLYDRVRVKTDKYISDGIRQGYVGYIIEVYDEDNFEVEFSDKNGITIGMLVVHKDDIYVDNPTAKS